MSTTLKKIYSDLSKFQRVANDYPTLKVKNLESTPFVKDERIIYKANIIGEKKPKKPVQLYTAYIEFQDVVFTETKDNDYSIKEINRGKKIYHKPITVDRRNIQLRCNCADFGFRFSKQLYDVEGLIGMYRKYKRVPGSTRPPVNPNDYLGVCKHLHNFIEHLKIMGKVK